MNQETIIKPPAPFQEEKPLSNDTLEHVEITKPELPLLPPEKLRWTKVVDCRCRLPRPGKLVAVKWDLDDGYNVLTGYLNNACTHWEFKLLERCGHLSFFNEVGLRESWAYLHEQDLQDDNLISLPELQWHVYNGNKDTLPILGVPVYAYSEPYYITAVLDIKNEEYIYKLLTSPDTLIVQRNDRWAYVYKNDRLDEKPLVLKEMPTKEQEKLLNKPYLNMEETIVFLGLESEKDFKRVGKDHGSLFPAPINFPDNKKYWQINDLIQFINRWK